MPPPFFPKALELLKSAIEKAGYPDKVVIGMDVAASEFFRNGKYDLDFKSPDDPNRYITGEKLGELYQSFIKNYPGEGGGTGRGGARTFCPYSGPSTLSPTGEGAGLASPTHRAGQLGQERDPPAMLFLTPPPPLPSVVSIEDPFDQDDWETWKKFLTQVQIQIVGDDLTVTNPKRIQKAVEQKACNCLLLKVNQIGSVTESIQA